MAPATTEGADPDRGGGRAGPAAPGERGRSTERKPLVFVHGYGDEGSSFGPWLRELSQRGYDERSMHVCSYASHSNEITIEDIAEAFERALRTQAGVAPDQDFDAIVHSTGMLVLRAWLTLRADRRARLKHLVGLAPATYGSPMAPRGRGLLGMLFSGNRERGPDFLEAGDRILDSLEPGSRFTWDLAHHDILGPESAYGPDATTPYVFTFCGTEQYTEGYRGKTNPKGSDGTVRLAACSLDTRKITLDLSREPRAGRVQIVEGPGLDTSLVPIAGLNHAAIRTSPTPELVDMVVGALSVSSEADFQRWREDADRRTRAERDRIEPWQQFVVHAVDEHDRPIPDFAVRLATRRADGRLEDLPQFDLDVHAYKSDQSFRCFHVNLRELLGEAPENLWVRVAATAGTPMVAYRGYQDDALEADSEPGSTAALNIYQHPGEWARFFTPFVTTLIELRLDREPSPPDAPSRLCWFL
jgi:pimeloyl-ACP methyl ester carboxylesterase